MTSMIRNIRKIFFKGAVGDVIDPVTVDTLPQQDPGVRVINTNDINCLEPFGYSVRLELPAEQGDSTEKPRNSTYILFEDGKELFPAHSMHATIINRGSGGYSHWHNFLYFSTSDNSDPRKNGRVYILKPVKPQRRQDIADLAGAARDARIAFAQKTRPFTDQKVDPRLGKNCRVLPFPYNNALAIASDVDGMTVGMARSIHEYIESQIGVNQGDSFWPSGNLSCQPENACIFFRNTSGDLNNKTASELLEMFHRGWFDSCHSWDDDFVEPGNICSPLDIQVQGEIEQVIDVNRRDTGYLAFGNYGLVINAQIDPGVKTAELILTDNRGGSHTVVLRGELLSSSGWEPADLVDGKYLLYSKERNQPVGSRLDVPGASIDRMVLSLKGSGRFALEGVCALPFHRAIVESQAPVLESLKMIPILMVCHGGKQFVSTMTSPTFKGPIFRGNPYRTGEADLRSSSAYHYDLLAQRGVSFICPARMAFAADDPHVPLNSASNLITELLIEDLSRDDRPIYIVPRYIAEEKEGHPYYARHADIHHNENLGFQLSEAIHQLAVRPGHAAIIYVHWGAADILLQPEQEIFNDQTVEALLVLSDLQADLSGLSGPRIWVTPASVLARYAAMTRDLDRHLDIGQKTVSIRLWHNHFCPIISRQVSFLHGATIYVDDPETTDVIIDNELYHFYKCNGPDESGRNSVTILDATSQKVIHGKVGFFDQAGVLDVSGGDYYFDAGLSVGKFTKNGPGAARLTFVPDSLELGDGRYFHFAYRKNSDSMFLGIGFTVEDRDEFIWCEEADRCIEYAGIRMKGSEAGKVKYRTYDLKDMSHNGNQTRRLPTGSVSRIHVILTGDNSADGDFVELHRISFLPERVDHRHPESAVIGGRVVSGEDGLEVFLRQDEEYLSTKTGYNGMFIFPDVKKGIATEVFMNSQNGKLHPRGYKIFESGMNCCNMEIRNN